MGLTAEKSGFDSRQEQETFLQNVQTSSGTYQVSNGNWRFFTEVKRPGREADNSLNLVMYLQFPHMSSCCDAKLINPLTTVS
jgi:hypothetical protein